METEAIMKPPKGVISHHEREVAELRVDRGLAVEYLKAAMESLTTRKIAPQGYWLSSKQLECGFQWSRKITLMLDQGLPLRACTLKCGIHAVIRGNAT
jgi:hypothetical protein